MRHRNSGRQLNRNSSHRKAMFRNMAVSLFQHEVIRTTVPKAKELRRTVEPLISMAKSDTVAKRRLAFSRLRDRDVVTKLFNEIAPATRLDQGIYRTSSAASGPATRRLWLWLNWWTNGPEFGSYSDYAHVRYRTTFTSHCLVS